MQEQLIERMKTLRLRGMANALEDSLTALSQKKLAPDPLARAAAAGGDRRPPGALVPVPAAARELPDAA